jgi:signal transduction histidine kinase
MGVAILASWLALGVAGARVASPRRLVAAGFAMGVAICSMHYIGMAAMRMQATLTYAPLLVALSAVIAIAASVAALQLADRVGRGRAGAMVQTKLAGGVAMGVAIAGMHYTGMAAARFEDADLPASVLRDGIGIDAVGGAGIGIATLLGLGLTLIGSLVDIERRRTESALRFLADASAALGESLETATIVRRVVTLLVPYLGDWATVDLVSETGELTRVASAARGARLDPLPERRVPVSEAGALPIATAIVAGEIVQLRDAAGEAGRWLGDPALADLVRRAHVCGALVAPFSVRGRIAGAVATFAGRSRREYGEVERGLIGEVARRLGTAIENAKLLDESREAVRARDDFLSIASHELRTPLTSLQLQVDFAQRKWGEPGARADPDRLLRTVKSVARQSARLNELVNELLDVARAQSGRLQLRPEDIDLAQLVGETVDRFREQLASAGCSVVLHDRPGVVGRWDRSRIEQVVTNLLTNAARYGAGHPVEVGVDAEDGVARIVVRDHGVGIAPADQQRIFERFERAASATHYGGLGLGLFITKQIVLAHGGSLRVESVPGSGATFVVELPRSGAPEVDAAGSPPVH